VVEQKDGFILTEEGNKKLEFGVTLTTTIIQNRLSMRRLIALGKASFIMQLEIKEFSLAL
jgi:hypothetical protein